MLLSSAGPGASVRYRELGVAGYLHKPVKPSELLDAIVTALATAEPAPEPERDATAGPTEETPARRLRVLLAEDNPINQELAVALLEMWGHTAVVADDGRQAVDAFLAGRFDLVLMDVQMPELGGFEATGLIREHERTAGGHVPIVAMTARAMKGDRAECLAAGMDEYVGKPIDRAELYAVIERVTAGTTAGAPGSAASDAA